MSIQLPWLFPFSDIALLLMRLLVGAVFVTSGWSHTKDPVARGKSIGLSPGMTRIVGVVEVAAGLGVAVGVLTQLAALGLIAIMLGAIQKKLMVWHTGFWGKHGTDGWHYDLMLLLMCLVIATTGGGRYGVPLLLGGRDHQSMRATGEAILPSPAPPRLGKGVLPSGRHSSYM
jgi:putative oxidoreductase